MDLIYLSPRLDHLIDAYATHWEVHRFVFLLNSPVELWSESDEVIRE